MGTSYRNMIDGEKLKDAIGSGDFSKVLKTEKNSANYIRGYADDNAIEGLANSMDINTGLFKQILGIETKNYDAYDPYHVSDAKKEEFWYHKQDNQTDPNDSRGAYLSQTLNQEPTKQTGKEILENVDENTYTFKNSLYVDGAGGYKGFRGDDFGYEDPLLPGFELKFNINESPFFSDKPNENSFLSFLQKYRELDPEGYNSREKFWTEFKIAFFKIFEKDINESDQNRLNKPYYITKIAGLEHLNKKMIKYGEDKITITLNEDVSMIAWYISELYNNIVYSYRNQRYMFPDNVLRFNMELKINDFRNFILPENASTRGFNVPIDKDQQADKKIKNRISDKSQIIYTLHDCNFNFFESKNYNNELEMGGYGTAASAIPSTVSFDIYFKSVTRWSKFPLKKQTASANFAYTVPTQTEQNEPITNINSWMTTLYDKEYKQNYYDEKTSNKLNTSPEKKGYLKQALTRATQNVVNQGLNYMDNLETRLREVRGTVVNDALSQLRNFEKINKIEPDNVYKSNFNNPVNLSNLGKQIGSSLLNDLENNARNAANF